MDSIISCISHMPNYTSISNTFIEDYMLAANGSYVKVYLYLAKCIQNGDANLSITSLADQMENTEKDILRALKYWQKVKLLKLTYADKETITGIELLNPEVVHYEQTALETAASKNTVSKTNLSANTPAKTESSKHTASKDFKWMTNIIEKYLDRLLTPTDIQTIQTCYETLGLSSELVLYLYEYCISKGKTSPSYIEKVAVAWAEKDITTVEQAKEASASYNYNYNAVSKAFGLNRALVPIEKRYIDEWMGKQHLDLGVIIEACNRTVLRTQKADFDYANKIIHNWLAAGLHTTADIAKADAEYAQKKAASYARRKNTDNGSGNSFNRFPQRDYSKEESDSLEQQLLHI